MNNLQKKLVVFTVPFTPMLKVVKDGCWLKNVEFIVLQPPKKMRFYVYQLFRVLGMDRLAVRIFAPTQYNRIVGYDGEKSIFLFWSSHLMSTWMTIAKIVNPSSKKVFSWGPFEEDLRDSKYFKRKLKRIEKCKNDGFQFYTYNPYDAEKYGMRLTTQVYRKNWNEPDQRIQRDFYFIGKSKGRDEILLAIKEILKKKGFDVDFRVFEDKPKEFVPFDENVRLSMGSKCIVDVVLKKNNAGQTLRPLEAVFFKKKLLTNDKSVMECDFYHPDNIFIFDEENVNLDGIEAFMKKPFCEIDESIVKKYDVNNWLKRYFFDEE